MTLSYRLTDNRTVPALQDRACKACGKPIRLTEAGWGHVEPYRVGLTHPRHRAVPR